MRVAGATPDPSAVPDEADRDGRVVDADLLRHVVSYT